jgi:hypothetical protein
MRLNGVVQSSLVLCSTHDSFSSIDTTDINYSLKASDAPLKIGSRGTVSTSFQVFSGEIKDVLVGVGCDWNELYSSPTAAFDAGVVMKYTDSCDKVNVWSGLLYDKETALTSFGIKDSDRHSPFVAPRTSKDPFVLSVWVKKSNVPFTVSAILYMKRLQNSPKRGIGLYHMREPNNPSRDKKLYFELIEQQGTKSISSRTFSTVILSETEWTNIAISYDGSTKARGLKFYVNGALLPSESETDSLVAGSNIYSNSDVMIGKVWNDSCPFEGKIRDVTFAMGCDWSGLQKSPHFLSAASTLGQGDIGVGVKIQSLKILRNITHIQTMSMCALATGLTVKTQLISFGWACNGSIPVLSVCSWTGVTCLSGAVVSIDIHNKGLQGTLATEVGILGSLTKLYIGNPSNTNKNMISGTIPTEVCQLSCLEFIHFNNLQISGTIPTEIGHLTKLSYIALGTSSSLSGTLPSDFGFLTNLASIWLSDADFSGTLPKELSLFTKLTRLYIANNPNFGPGLPCLSTTVSDLNYTNSAIDCNYPSPDGDTTVCKSSDIPNVVCDSFPCSDGYISVLGICCPYITTLPANSSYTTSRSCDWSCDDN